MKVRWLGTPPEKCDLCGTPITDEFVDGKTRMGPWGNMDIACHKRVGVGLGTGKGQRFKLQDGQFVKVEG
jgi:hypothetical protein